MENRKIIVKIRIKTSKLNYISDTNNSGLRPSLLGGFPPQAKLASENTPNFDSRKSK
jgi:hypothetical protein